MTPGTHELQVTALGYLAVSTEPLTVTLDAEARIAITMESQPLVLDRLIITATKTPSSTREVTALVTVVEREEIDARGDLELVDALEGRSEVPIRRWTMSGHTIPKNHPAS